VIKRLLKAPVSGKNSKDKPLNLILTKNNKLRYFNQNQENKNEWYFDYVSKSFLQY